MNILETSQKILITLSIFKELYLHSKPFRLHHGQMNQLYWTFFNSHACQANLYGCKSKLKFEQYKLEIQHIIKVFRAVYKKFLTAIDHID